MAIRDLSLLADSKSYVLTALRHLTCKEHSLYMLLNQVGYNADSDTTHQCPAVHVVKYVNATVQLHFIVNYCSVPNWISTKCALNILLYITHLYKVYTFNALGVTCMITKCS